LECRENECVSFRDFNENVENGANYLFNSKIAFCALPARVFSVMLKEPAKEKSTPK